MDFVEVWMNASELIKITLKKRTILSAYFKSNSLGDTGAALCK